MSQQEDPFNVVHRVLLKKGRTSKISHEELRWDAFSTERFDKKEAADKETERAVTKIHPLLKKWMAERGRDTERLLVGFREDLIIPRFPEPASEERRTSVANKRAQKLAQQLVAEIQERRAERYKQLTQELREYEAKVVETFWLISGALVEMPLNRVSDLSKREDVLFVEPRNAGEQPPQNTNANDDVDDGRARIVSDPYFNLGLRGGFIGLLDTGLRFTHTQFNSPSTIAFRRDCVNGGPTCTAGAGFDPTDDCWNHGTSTAAIITGNANQGAAFRGVTAITLDSFKVYPAACGGLDGAAVVRAFQAAVAVLDRVIVAEMQGGGDDLSAISRAADSAFDAGAVIIAANGNNGPNASTVNTPANAHRVIGVGNFDVQTQVQVASQSRGPAPDGRFKPDIQAPTNTETASSASDTAFRLFGGTSGATPYAAGAAALLRNWLRGASFSIDPGQVYAQLILAGQQPYPFNNTSGAGPLRLPTDGWAWWGKVSVSNGMTIDIPLNISGGSPNTLDGALWWPEWAFQFPLVGRIEVHNDVDLHLVDPRGSVRASSISIPSVFERARVNGAVTAGTWRLRIRGYNVNGTQTVYWAAHVRLS
ncbi:MAG TPA: S8 family serine peptidase, partial [Vicinamibacterales bacterium]|nr:S8 family serine peptidase [Vicinamibacterales bacterium]